MRATARHASRDLKNRQRTLLSLDQRAAEHLPPSDVPARRGRKEWHVVRAHALEKIADIQKSNMQMPMRKRRYEV